MNYDLMRRLQEEPSEEHLWDMILSYQNIMFKTYSGLPFTYEVRKGRNGEYTKELWIDRREKSKSLAWSSVKLAFHNIKQTGEIVEAAEGSWRYQGRYLHLWNVLSIWTDRCTG